MATETVEQRDGASADHKTAWSIASDLAEIQDRLRIAEELITDHISECSPADAKSASRMTERVLFVVQAMRPDLEAFDAQVEALYAIAHKDRLTGGGHAAA